MFKGIVLHWTAGNYYPCEWDKTCYHYLIDKDGKIYKGKYKPEDNLDCTDGKYAAHAGGFNTGRIGVALCCRKNKQTPPTQQQVEKMCELAACLCTTYGISVSNVQTHAELSPNRKIDINDIPYLHLQGIKTVANYLRQQIQKYLNKGKYNE